MNKNALVINDSRFEREVMKGLLNNLGYQVRTAGEDISIQQIDSYKANLIIVNMTMKNICGIELIDMIKSKRPQLKCYLSSCSPVKKEDYLESKVDGVFQTPINVLDLGRILDGEELEFYKDEQLGSINNISNEIKANFNEGKSIKNHKKDFAFCPYCGEKIDRRKSEFIFCPFCGGKL